MSHPPGRSGAIPMHNLRRTTRQSPNNLKGGFTELEKQFLCATSNVDDVARLNEDAAKAYLTHFRSISEGGWSADPDPFLNVNRTPLLSAPKDKAMRFCCDLMVVYREKNNLSICRAIKELQDRGLVAGGDDLRSDPEAQQLVFRAIGWISLLYVPDFTLRRTSFRIKVASEKTEIKASATMDRAERPLDELLRSFGDLLPKKQTSDISTTKLLVRFLNMDTMTKLAKIKIKWVASPSAHLEFDITGPSISIFQCPSLCEVQKSSESILTVMLQEYYSQEEEKPCKDFSVQNYLQEIKLSYALLFRHTRKSRHLFRKTERKEAEVSVCGQGYLDPWLEKLCCDEDTASGRESYDTESEFPILGERLMRVQRYVGGAPANNIRDIWRDHRDPKLWYTLWIVILLQIVALIIGIISTVLTGMQVYYAEQAYSLQLRQTSLKM